MPVALLASLRAPGALNRRAFARTGGTRRVVRGDVRGRRRARGAWREAGDGWCIRLTSLCCTLPTQRIVPRGAERARDVQSLLFASGMGPDSAGRARSAPR